MKAITKLLAAGAAIAGFAAATPAAAQYYPGYGYPGYGYGSGGAIGSIINSVTGNYGYGNYGYAYNGYNVPGGSQVAANQCSAAVQQRLGYGGYGYGAGYGQGVRVNSVEVRSGGGYRVRGVAAAGGAYGYNGGAIGFSCRTDPRGLVVDVDLGGNRGYGYGYGNNGYYGSNYADPYAAYGYHRY